MSGSARTRIRRDVTINVRASARIRELIDQAAAVAGKTRTEFMLDSARREAEDVLLDRRLFGVDEARYAAFLDALDAPPPPPPELRRLLAGKAPWKE